MAREELLAVERAFGQLAPEKQEVIVRNRLIGMSHAEIAKDRGKTEGAVRSMLSRALAELASGL